MKQAIKAVHRQQQALGKKAEETSIAHDKVKFVLELRAEFRQGLVFLRPGKDEELALQSLVRLQCCRREDERALIAARIFVGFRISGNFFAGRRRQRNRERGNLGVRVRYGYHRDGKKLVVNRRPQNLALSAQIFNARRTGETGAAHQVIIKPGLAHCFMTGAIVPFKPQRLDIILKSHWSRRANDVMLRR